MNKTFNHKDDLTTWHLMKLGDSAAFEHIYQQHVQSLFRYGFSILPNEVVVMDLIHDLFSNIWRTRSRLSDTNSIKFYLFRSLKNRIIRHAKVAGRLPVSDQDLHADLVFLHAENAEDSETMLLLHHKLESHLAELSPRQQEIVRLRFYEDLSHQEIAELLGMNVQSAKNLLHRAILALRQHFAAGVAIWLYYFLGTL